MSEGSLAGTVTEGLPGSPVLRLSLGPLTRHSILVGERLRDAGSHENAFSVSM